MERWQLMNATHLLLTHMDEASQHGHVLGLAAESNIPISFLSWGRRIPEDLDPATRERLIRLVLDEPQAVSGAAA
jgi:flagellar biosynthesis protein FlhF